MKVKDAMTREVEVVRPEASLKEVASILAEHRISGLPVVDEAGDVVGVVSGGGRRARPLALHSCFRALVPLLPSFGR